MSKIPAQESSIKKFPSKKTVSKPTAQPKSGNLTLIINFISYRGNYCTKEIFNFS